VGPAGGDLRSAATPPVVAASLDISVGPGRRPLEALRAALAPKRMLLVLDNCEHLLVGCATLAQDILSACHGVRNLATSREGLGLMGETCWLVPPLSLPPTGRRLTGSGDSEATALFLERAQAVNRSLNLDGPNADAAADVCRRLDGLPLAIELAAAWANVLSLREIADRLASGAGLLVGPRSTAARHKTLQATVQWSLELLSDCERLFEQLSAFRGGFTLEAAQAVTARDVLSSLARLVDASLVVPEPDKAGGARYRILEPLREVAHERLAARAGAEVARERHAEYFLALAESVQDWLWDQHARRSGIPRLEREVDNLRVALRWLIQQPDAERASRMGTALARFWEFGGHVVEGRAWLGELLALDGVSQTSRARLLVGAAAAATHDLDLAAARSLLDSALPTAREASDDWAIA
jgi:predicted ATPase